MPGPKEETYDKQIFPLMAEIITICERHKIAFLADFLLGRDDYGCSVKCTTSLLEEEYEPSVEQLEAMKHLSPKTPAFMAITVTKGGK